MSGRRMAKRVPDQGETLINILFGIHHMVEVMDSKVVGRKQITPRMCERLSGKEVGRHMINGGGASYRAHKHQVERCVSILYASIVFFCWVI